MCTRADHETRWCSEETSQPSSALPPTRNNGQKAAHRDRAAARRRLAGQRAAIVVCRRTGDGSGVLWRRSGGGVGGRFAPSLSLGVSRPSSSARNRCRTQKIDTPSLFPHTHWSAAIPAFAHDAPSRRSGCSCSSIPNDFACRRSRALRSCQASVAPPPSVDALLTSSRRMATCSLEQSTSDRAHRWRMAALRGAPRRTPPGKPSDSVRCVWTLPTV